MQATHLIDLPENISNKNGFTLVELMIVVAIVSILSAIAIPQFDKYRSKSFNAAAATDVKNFKSGLESYYVDSKAYIVNI